jgi:hypothetical protein
LFFFQKNTTRSYKPKKDRIYLFCLAPQIPLTRLLRALGASPDGELYPLLYEPGDLQGAGDAG